MRDNSIGETVADRFLRYVRYDTQSSSESKTYPSTEKQKDFGKILVQELKELGLQDAETDGYGYVTATLRSNAKTSVPTIGLIAHMDTSPEVSGKNVRPQIRNNYQGGDIALPRDQTQVIRLSESAELARKIGHDIITSDGTTLLGADDKAGIAEIIDAIHYLIHHPQIDHGDIRVAFTPDEEVAAGVKYFDIRKFGAKYAYTLDGETIGEIEDETFFADTMLITFYGVIFHPGYAKGKLVNSIKIASDFVQRLPRDAMSPETTEGKEGFVHPNDILGGIDRTGLRIIVRDFEEKGLEQKEEMLRKLAEEAVENYPQGRVEVKIERSYRNMKYVLDRHPEVLRKAEEAIKMAGLEPKRHSIRGGTDGARLSYMGLPTPNIATGGHNFHSRLEWISVQDMKKAVEIIVDLAKAWTNP